VIDDLLGDALERGREIVGADREDQPVGAELAGQRAGTDGRICEAAVGRRARVRDLGPRARRRAA